MSLIFLIIQVSKFLTVYQVLDQLCENVDSLDPKSIDEVG